METFFNPQPLEIKLQLQKPKKLWKPASYYSTKSPVSDAVIKAAFKVCVGGWFRANGGLFC